MYTQLRNDVKRATNKAFHLYVNDLFTDGSDNRKRFFAFVRSRRKNPGPILIDNNGSVEHDPSRIAEAFGNYFSGLTGNSSEESSSFLRKMIFIISYRIYNMLTFLITTYLKL